jgi:membrane protein required for colicin V production
VLLTILLRGIYIPSILDFVFILFIFFGIFRGYTQGIIVQTIALFVLLAGIYISAIVSMAFYETIVDKSNVPLKNLPVIIFSLLFAVVVFASNWVAIYIKKMVATVKVTIYSRVWGAFFGALKYLFIASVIFLFIQRLDQSFKLFDEDSETRLFEPVAKFAPTVIPKLKFEIRQPAPMELDDITNDPEPIEELEELDE